MTTETGPRPTDPASGPTPGPDFTGEHPRCCHGRAPWPLVAAGVGGAFWLFPPLGVAGLAYLAMRGRHGHGRGRGDGAPPWAGRGFRGFRGRGRHPGGSGNLAFDEARAEAWRHLEEEAEAFDDFRRRDRMARDRDTYDRFRAERGTPAKPAGTGGDA